MQTSDESDFPQETAAALFLRHITAWITQVFLSSGSALAAFIYMKRTQEVWSESDL